MLILLSPAKTLDYDTPSRTETFTKPVFLKESKQLVESLRELSPQDLAQLMGISDKLAVLNATRYETWKTPFNPKNAKQAALAFKGDVYVGLDAETLNDEDDTYAQEHVRILSGLYGMLKPLDLIQPYRLEMGVKYPNARGKDLYAFWRDGLTKAINKTLKEQDSEIIINLASNEYFKAVDPKALKARVITPAFKDMKNGEYKMISFYAKKARGLMTRYMIQNRITNVEQIKDFDLEGYSYNKGMSKDDQWVFTRDEA